MSVVETRASGAGGQCLTDWRISQRRVWHTHQNSDHSDPASSPGQAGAGAGADQRGGGGQGAGAACSGLHSGGPTIIMSGEVSTHPHSSTVTSVTSLISSSQSFNHHQQHSLITVSV